MTTAGKSAKTYLMNIAVQALPAWAYGTFNGGSPSNQVQLAVTAAGKLSGKLLEDGVTYVLAAPSYAAYDAETDAFYADLVASWSYKDGKKTVKTNETWMVTVAQGAVGGLVAAERFDAWQNLWTLAAWKTLGKDLFTARGTVEVFAGGEYGLVKGESVTLTIKPAGTVTVKGVFNTGTVDRKGNPVYYTASGSAAVCAMSDDPFVGEVFVYFPPNAAKGFEGYVWCFHVEE